MAENKISAAILSGGKGTRFIPHKGLLNLGGKSIITAQIEALRGIFDDVVIVANEPWLYNGLGAGIITDIIPDKGPLGGIYTALTAAGGPYVFVIAADMPYVNIDLIKHMRDNLSGYDIAAPRARGKLQPLYTVYSKACLPVIKKHLDKNKLKVADIFPCLKTRIITEKEILRFDPRGISFTNINTSKDYERIINR